MKLEAAASSFHDIPDRKAVHWQVPQNKTGHHESVVDLIMLINYS